MAALWVLAGIVVFLGLLLLLPLKLAVRYDAESGLSLRLMLIFIPLADTDRVVPPEKKPASASEKQPAPKKKKSGGAVQTMLSLLGLGEVNSDTKFKNAVAERGLPAVLATIAAVVRRFLSHTLRCLGAGVFRRFDLRVVIGEEDAADAAMQYGLACAAVYPLVSLLEQSMTLRHRSVSVEMGDDPQTAVTADILLVYRVWHFVRYGFFLLNNYLKEQKMHE